MAKTVTVDLVSQPLSREENGVIFDVKEGDGAFGRLIVSKGGVRWRPKNNKDHHFLSWADLDKASRDYPRRSLAPQISPALQPQPPPASPQSRRQVSPYRAGVPYCASLPEGREWLVNPSSKR